MSYGANRQLVMLLVVPLLFLAIFYFYPLTKIILLSFSPPEGFAHQNISTIFSSSTYLRIIWFTVWQAGLSTLLTLIFALPGAYVFAKYSFPGKNLLLSLTTVPFVLPTVVTAAAFRALLGSNGLVNNFCRNVLGVDGALISIEQTVFFFLLAHIFYNYALVLRIVGSYWAGIAPELKAAALMLGASPQTIFFRVTLPLLMPAIGSAAILVFIFCFTSFGVVLILGGPACATIEVEIYRQAIHLFNLPMAATLSIIQILINFVFMWCHAAITQKSRINFLTGTGRTTGVKPASWSARLTVVTNTTFMAILLVFPLAALVISSFTGHDGMTLAYYRNLFMGETSSLLYVPPLEAVRNSVGFALLTMLIAMVLGIFAASALAADRRRWSTVWDAILMLPLATSAVTLGFGYIITLNRPPLNLRDSLALVPLAHTLVAFPFVLRCLLPPLRRLPSSLTEAASLLGAPPMSVWLKIKLPLLKTALLGAAVFSFSVSMGEFGASAFVARPHLPTMPVAIFRFLGQPGELNFGQAMAMSTILMLITCCGFWLIGKLDTSADSHRTTQWK